MLLSQFLVFGYSGLILSNFSIDFAQFLFPVSNQNIVLNFFLGTVEFLNSSNSLILPLNSLFDDPLMNFV